MYSSFTVRRRGVSFFAAAIVVAKCHILFSYLPLKCQIDIRTASFMLRFMATENSICNLFAIQAAGILTDIYIRYSESVDSIDSLKNAILRQFTGILVLFHIFIVLFY